VTFTNPIGLVEVEIGGAIPSGPLSVVGFTECCGFAVADVSIAAVALVVTLSQQVDADGIGLVIINDDPIIGVDAVVVIAFGAFAMLLSARLDIKAASLLARVIVVDVSLSSLIRLFAGSPVVNLISSSLLIAIVEVNISIHDDFG